MKVYTRIVRSWVWVSIAQGIARDNARDKRCANQTYIYPFWVLVETSILSACTIYIFNEVLGKCRYSIHYIELYWMLSINQFCCDNEMKL